MKRSAFVVLCLALASPCVAEAEGAGLACFERRPEPDSARTMHLTALDAAGKRSVLILRLYGRRNAQGLGQLFLRVEGPEPIRGTSLLMLQRADAETAIYVASPEQPKPRAIQGSERTERMFGMDFSYEDLERIQHGWRPGGAELVELPSEPVGGRAAYVIEVRPRHSAWERIVFDLNPRNCLPVRLRYFERGKTTATKEATVDPRGHVRRGDIWVAQNAAMRDLGKHTTTDLTVDAHAQAALIPDTQFTVEGLERAVREAAPPPP